LNYTDMRRMAGAGMIVVGVGILAACSGEAPAAPEVQTPLFGQQPPGGPQPTTSTVTYEAIKVCKVYSGQVGPDVIVDVVIDQGNNGGADQSFQTTIGDGDCSLVWIVGGNIEDKITLTEQVPAGYTASHVSALLGSDKVTVTTGASVPGNSVSETARNIGTVTGVVVTFTNTFVPSTGCTLTQGFWKTHTGLGAQADAWPALPGGTLALGSVNYTKAQLISIFNTAPKGNGLITLAHQLIAAKLNILNGADPTAISATIAAADALIGALVVPPVGSGFLAPSAVSALVTALDDFNTGDTGPGHCDDLEVIDD